MTLGPGRHFFSAVCVALAVVSVQPRSTLADEGGVSFWTPGEYGSFAAIAPSPGWSLPFVFYNYGGSLGAQQSITRAIFSPLG